MRRHQIRFRELLQMQFQLLRCPVLQDREDVRPRHLEGVRDLIQSIRTGVCRVRIDLNRDGVIVAIGSL